MTKDEFTTKVKDIAKGIVDHSGEILSAAVVGSLVLFSLGYFIRAVKY